MQLQIQFITQKESHSTCHNNIMKHNFNFVCLSVCWLALLVITSHVSDALTLRGVVSEYSEIPGFYVRKVARDHYEGYTIDILNEIAAKLGFNYTLYDSPQKVSLHDGKSGNKIMYGPVGEVHKKRADFAIGNVDNYALFHPYVIFSDPILQYQQYAALISRANPHHFCTIEDMLKMAEQRQFHIGALGHFWYFKYFLNISEGPFVARLNKVLLRDLNLVMDVEDALENIKQKPNLAYLMKSNMAEYLAEHDCGVTVVHNHFRSQPREIGIAFQKGSHLLAPVNKAIRELHEDGTIERLRKRYWTTGKCAKQRCVNGSIVNINNDKS